MTISGSATPSSAITVRLEELEARWNRFALDPDARLLRWVVPSEDAVLVWTFIEAQNSEAGTIPDLFVRLDVPFTKARSSRSRWSVFGSRDAVDDRSSYGRDLVASFVSQYSETKEGLVAAELCAGWSPPADDPTESDTSYFSRACASFREHYASSVERLCVILTPLTVGDSAAWTRWLLALLPLLPTTVRVLVVAVAENPLLDGLADGDKRRVRSDAVNPDLSGAVTELAKYGGGNPAADRFRRAFVALTTAVGRGDMLTAQREAHAALGVATRSNWKDMQVAVHLALGAGWQSMGDADSALVSCRAARNVAQQMASGDAAASPLQVLTLMAEGGALLAAGEHAKAAEAYEVAAQKAEDVDDQRMALDGWRMAAHCRERAEDLSSAWRLGWRALDAGGRLDTTQRESSTLPHAGTALLRVGEALRLTDAESRVDARMTELLGDTWRTVAASVEIGG